MEWELDNSRPIWPQLRDHLARRIITGHYPPGSRLPSVRELAAQAGVNPNTMQRALAQLEQEGLCRAGRTAGRVVTQDTAVLEAVRAREAQAVIKGYFDAMAGLGYTREQAAAFLKEEFS